MSQIRGLWSYGWFSDPTIFWGDEEEEKESAIEKRALPETGVGVMANGDTINQDSDEEKGLLLDKQK